MVVKQHVLELVPVIVSDVMHNAQVVVKLDALVIVQEIVSAVVAVLVHVLLCARRHVAESV